ncbi:MAG: HIT domain-containing protein [Desulfobacterales bacterium]
MGNECIFCDIVDGKKETEFIFEDELVVVFKDINPHAPVHDLIVPRQHIRSINDMSAGDQALLGHMLKVGRDVAGMRGIGAAGYKLLFNVERGGGQMIFHLHLHLLGGWVK